MIRLAIQMLLLILLLSASTDLAWRAIELLDAPIAVASAPHVWSPATVIDESLPRLDQKPLTAFSQTMARPIFFEGRRFPVKQVVTPKAIPPQPPKTIVSANQFRLLGIVQHGEDKRALIEGPSLLLDWYMEGAKLQDWTLSRIENDGIFLSFEKQSAELRLFGGADQK